MSTAQHKAEAYHLCAKNNNLNGNITVSVKTI